jgi:hypothetical protein
MRGCTCTGSLWCPQCQGLAVRAGLLDAPAPPPLSEKAFLTAVVRLAREHGWLCWHAYNARKSLPGYPDLTLCHPSGQRPLLFAELKVPGGQLTLQQHAWLEALTLAQEKEVQVWTPEDMPRIVWALTR